MKSLLKRIERFNNKRHWDKLNDVRSLILALCSELGELAHIFRWRKRAVGRLSHDEKKQVELEIADIFIFLFGLCLRLGIDPEKAINEKIKINERRFPG
jgi:NTP pyrophosphatase (non-canonical NTP hydrolase)